MNPNNPNLSSVDGVIFNKDQTKLVLYPRGRQGVYVIPNSVTTIEQGAFYECKGLISVIIPNSVTSIESLAFSSCTGLISVILSSNLTSCFPCVQAYLLSLVSIRRRLLFCSL